MNGKRRQFQHLVLVLVVLVATLGILPLTGPTAARHSLSKADGEFIVYLPAAGSNIQPGTGPGTGGRIYAYSDAAIVLPNDVLLPMQQMQKAQICQVRAAANPITLQQALQNGWAYLTQQVGSANLAMFRAAAEVATPEGAQAFAFAAMSDRRPDGALAALLHAHELEPQSPLILINAAGMFAILDMPNEAIALLDAAAALPEPVAAETPMGIPAAHLAANNRAYALLLQGRWQQAEAILAPLVQSGTDLSEARLNLSQAHLCQDEDEDAVRMYRLGARRLMLDEFIDGGDPPIQLPPDLTLNRSAGKLFTLPPLGTFQKPEQAESVMNYLDELMQRNSERGAELLDLIDANTDARNQRPRPGPLTAARFNNIYTTAMRAIYEPDIEALYQAAADKDTRISELLDEQADEWLDLADDYTDWNAYTEACRSLLRSHVPQWMSEYGEFEAHLQAYTTAKYAAMTGAAANLADELNHEYVMLNIEYEMNNDVDWRLGALYRYAGTISPEWNWCQGVAEANQNEDSQAQYDRPDRCSDALTRGKLGINFIKGLVQIRLNCEVVEVEVSGAGFLTIFGQVSVDMRNKTATFFTGAKIQSPTGMGRLSVNEGFFLTVGENGVSEGGMRITTSADVGIGQFVGVIDGPGMEFGVAAAVEYLTTPTQP
jgi:hypothetical protein